MQACTARARVAEREGPLAFITRIIGVPLMATVYLKNNSEGLLAFCVGLTEQAISYLLFPMPSSVEGMHGSSPEA